MSKNRPGPAQRNKLPSIPNNPILQQDQESKVSRVHREISVHHGPLPSPQVLKQYEEIIPGLSKQIVDMAQFESAHRWSIEQQSAATERRGQHYALIIAIVGFSCAAWLGYLGLQVPAGIVGGAPLALMVGYFLSKKATKKDQDKH